MSGEIFVGVFLAGIALMLVYWLFTSFHWLTLLILAAVLWLVIHLLTKERPTEEQKERGKKLAEKEEENAARIERNRIKNLRGFAKFWHHFSNVWFWTSSALILLGILITVFTGFK